MGEGEGSVGKVNSSQVEGRKGPLQTQLWEPTGIPHRPLIGASS